MLSNLELIERELSARCDSRPVREARLDDVELARMVGDARTGAARIARIVRDLRTLTRPDDAVREQVDLPRLLEQCLEMCQHQIRHRARVERAIETTPPVVCDEGRLVQVFVNLLVNAAHAIPEGAASSHFIRVSCGGDGQGHAIVEIQDSGSGMPPEVLARIFDPFFTTKKLGEGSGLGLAICQSIVSELGGAIEVDSAPARGTTFRVRLPAANELARPAAPKVQCFEQPTSPLRILAIDDEPAVGRVLRRMLRGHETIVETHALDALARLEAGEHFDRIFVDVMMPDVTGMDFYKALSELEPSLLPSVIFMTGGAFSDRTRAFWAKVDNLQVEKPFQLAALLDVLAQVRAVT